MWTSVKTFNSSDKNVKKYIFERDNAIAESVLYKYPTYEERTVICCSTQSGCPIGCRFCFLPGTLIPVLNRGLTKIEDICIDDILYSQSGYDTKVVNLVRTYCSCVMIDIELENGQILSVTSDHEMVYADKTTTVAENLYPDCKLLSVYGYQTVKSIKKYRYCGYVYNVRLSPDPVFLTATNVFTHNCGTGEYFVRSFKADEIVSQPQRLIEDTGVDAADMQRLQIMFMSMGEPLLNLKELILAMEKLYELYPKAALLISTSGPAVDYEPLFEAAERIPTIGLQFSVHESTNEARNNLIPFKHKLTLEQLADMGERFFARTSRTPFFNYCVHDKNNTQEDADRLKKIFNPLVWQATISVICERDETINRANERQQKLADDFRDKLNLHNYRTRVFNPAGQDDISGGCGQLHQTQKWFKEHSELARPTVGYGLPIIHSPR